MKTKNNVQKAVMKSLAVIMSLVLLSITVQAQDFWATVLSNNSFHQIALALTSETDIAATTSPAEANVNAAIFETEAEAMPEIEAWMVDESNFYGAPAFETELENSLPMEAWMMNDNIFNGTARWFEVEAEPALEMEQWMSDETLFEVNSAWMEEAVEASLELESWMTDSKIWEL